MKRLVFWLFLFAILVGANAQEKVARVLSKSAGETIAGQRLEVGGVRILVVSRSLTDGSFGSDASVYREERDEWVMVRYFPYCGSGYWATVVGGFLTVAESSGQEVAVLHVSTARSSFQWRPIHWPPMNIPPLTEKKEPNKAPEPTTGTVTPRAPSSTSRASHGRGSS